MTKTEPIDKGGDQPALRVDIFFTPGDRVDPQWSLARLGQIAREPIGDGVGEDLGALACRMYKARRHRARFLSVSMLGEPVWDMLLALYCFGARGEKLWVSGLRDYASVPPTTASRWIAVMEQKGLVVRIKDKDDARRAFVKLSDSGAKMMEDYLRSISATLLPQ